MRSTLRTPSKTKSVAVLLAMVLPFLSLLSCQEEGVKSVNERKYGGTLTATVDGDIISVSQIGIYVAQGFLSLEKKGFCPFDFGVNNGIAENSYDLIIGGGARLSYTNDDNVVYALAATKVGEFIITKIDEVNGTMSGTFQATLQNVSDQTDKVTVSNGIFTDVPYVVQKEATGNTHIAVVDGVELKGTLGTGSTIFHVLYKSDYKLIDLTFPHSDVPVVYNIAEFDDPYYKVVYTEGLYSYRATSGNITVTSVDVANKKVEGTYSVTVESIPISGVTKQITEGVFSFTYL